MKTRFCILFLVIPLLIVMPPLVYAQTEAANTGAGPPPIGQQLVREGAFAVSLLSALDLGTTEDEVEAETLLGELGIAPKNGWIADYPVTPDILGELENAIIVAADSQKLQMGKDEALRRFQDVTAKFGLSVTSYSGTRDYKGSPSGSPNYPNPTVINNYYNMQGPPVVTYYTPPPDYYYLYSWVPYPFWGASFWFPGFFVLNDFHRVIVVNRGVFFVSNHFRDVRVHRVLRIDPVQRFRGKTFHGIGIRHGRDFIGTEVPKSERRIFNRPHTEIFRGPREVAPLPRIVRPPGKVIVPREGEGGAGGGAPVTKPPRIHSPAVPKMVVPPSPAQPSSPGATVAPSAPLPQPRIVSPPGKVIVPKGGDGGAGGGAPVTKPPRIHSPAVPKMVVPPSPVQPHGSGATVAPSAPGGVKRQLKR